MRMPFALIAAAGLVLTGCSSQPDVAASDSDAQFATQLDQIWATFHAEFPDVERPTVPVKRVIERSEWVAVMVDCLTEAGFPDVEASADGQSYSSGEGAQLQSFRLADYVCNATYPQDPKYFLPVNDAQLEYLYAYYVDELVPCLQAEGYSPLPAPSKQAFVDAGLDNAEWWPYKGLSANMDDAEWTRINQICPQGADDDIYDLAG